MFSVSTISIRSYSVFVASILSYSEFVVSILNVEDDGNLLLVVVFCPNLSLCCRVVEETSWVDVVVSVVGVVLGVVLVVLPEYLKFFANFLN